MEQPSLIFYKTIVLNYIVQFIYRRGTKYMLKEIISKLSIPENECINVYFGDRKAKEYTKELLLKDKQFITNNEDRLININHGENGWELHFKDSDFTFKNEITIDGKVYKEYITTQDPDSGKFTVYVQYGINTYICSLYADLDTDKWWRCINLTLDELNLSNPPDYHDVISALKCSDPGYTPFLDSTTLKFDDFPDESNFLPDSEAYLEHGAPAQEVYFSLYINYLRSLVKSTCKTFGIDERHVSYIQHLFTDNVKAIATVTKLMEYCFELKVEVQSCIRLLVQKVYKVEINGKEYNGTMNIDYALRERLKEVFGDSLDLPHDTAIVVAAFLAYYDNHRDATLDEIIYELDKHNKLNFKRRNPVTFLNLLYKAGVKVYCYIA